MKGDFQERGKKYMEKDKVAQKRHGVVRVHQMIFPNSNGIPYTARLALWILQRHDARIMDSLKDAQKEEKT